MTPPGGNPMVRRADVLWRRVADGVMIRRRGDDETVVLTGSGVALWSALVAPVSVSDLARQLAAAHGTTPDVVAADIAPVLDDLVERGVVRRD
jgi:hypothetical protein